MLQNLQSAIKTRAIAVFLIVHVGLGLSLFAMARVATLDHWDMTASLYLGGILCLYLGFLLGVFFIVGPILPWISRARQIENWTQRVLHDLPALLEHLPKIIAAIQALIVVWNEAKKKPDSQPVDKTSI